MNVFFNSISIIIDEFQEEVDEKKILYQNHYIFLFLELHGSIVELQ